MLLLTQMDKIVLSKLVSLEQFGYYTLAASIAAVLLQLMTPITQVYYPLLTRLIVQDDKKSLIVNFHTSSRIVSVFIVPFSIIIFFFAKDLLLVWTRNAELTDQTYQILQILIIGNALNCVIQMPYFLQLANGHTSWGVRVSLVALLFSIPATIFGSIYFGVIGAASVWLIVNLLHFVVSINFITEPIFIKQKLSWYFRDVLSPFFIVISCVIMFIQINPFEITSLIGFLLFSSFFICLYLLIFCIFLNSHFKQLLKFGKN
jgi:O-antigen/teichoic acid export membrane protein